MAAFAATTQLGFAAESIVLMKRLIIAAGRLRDTLFFLPVDRRGDALHWLLNILGIDTESTARSIELDRDGVAIALRALSEPILYKASPDAGGYTMVAQRFAQEAAGARLPDGHTKPRTIQ
jgi:hypothetical protein